MIQSCFTIKYIVPIRFWDRLHLSFHLAYQQHDPPKWICRTLRAFGAISVDDIACVPRAHVDDTLADSKGGHA